MNATDTGHGHDSEVPIATGGSGGFAVADTSAKLKLMKGNRFLASICKDIGVITTENGWNLYAGGNGG